MGLLNVNAPLGEQFEVVSNNSGKFTAVVDGPWSPPIPLATTAPVDVSKFPAQVGVAGSSARADHKHDIATAVPTQVVPGAVAAEGGGSALARAAHEHALADFGLPGAVVPGDTAATGAAATFANSAHRHAMAGFAVPVSIGTTNAEGIAPTFARSDHVHAFDPIVTSRITFAPGSRTVTFYTVPAAPTGSGRFVLTRCLVRLAATLVGTGNVTFRIGSTSGGSQVILPIVINSATVMTVLAGEALATLGADMTVLNAYEAVYAAGQAFFANLVIAGVVTGGYVDVYLYGLPLLA